MPKETKTAESVVSLKNKRALITGAASGIGATTALRFSQAGADLVLLDIDEAGLAQTAATLGSGVSPQLHTIDISDKSQIDAVWERLASEPPDILVNNAGVYPFKDYLEIDAQFLADTLDTNLNSMFWMSQQFVRRRMDKGGIIVNVSSIEAVLPFKEDLVPYSISKSGVLALTRSLAREYGRKGFRVNAVLPGGIRTPGTSRLAKKAIRKLSLRLIKTGWEFQSRIALGRWGDPDEVAKVILFLASDLASYVQGALVPVDGGFLSS